MGGRCADTGVKSKALVAILMLVNAAPLWGSDCADNSVDLRLATGGSARFGVEVVDTPQTRARGLMYREKMTASAGMLFIYEQPQRAVFWMKNTLIPLDMIFADATGVVTHVHANAIPQDETGIDGGEGVLAVLEINAGLAGRLGITPGAVLRHPKLDQRTAAWACSPR